MDYSQYTDEELDELLRATDQGFNYNPYMATLPTDMGTELPIEPLQPLSEFGLPQEPPVRLPPTRYTRPSPIETEPPTESAPIRGGGQYYEPGAGAAYYSPDYAQITPGGKQYYQPGEGAPYYSPDYTPKKMDLSKFSDAELDTLLSFYDTPQAGAPQLPTEEGSVVGNIIKAPLRGILGKAPQTIGSALKFFDEEGGSDYIRGLGTLMENLGKQAEESDLLKAPNPEDMGEAQRFVVNALESVGQSASMVIPTAAALSYGLPALGLTGLGVLGTTILSYALSPAVVFGLAESEKKYQNLKEQNPNMDDGDRRFEANLYGSFEFIGEFVGGLASALIIGKGAAPAVKAGTKGALMSLRNIFSKPIKGTLKDILRSSKYEVGGELATAFGERWVDQRTGTPTPSMWETIYEVGPTAFLAHVFMGAGLSGFHKVKSNQMRNILGDGEADPKLRQQAADEVKNKLIEHDPDGDYASIWGEFSQEHIDRKQNISLDLDLLKVFARVKEGDVASENLRHIKEKVNSGQELTDEEKVLLHEDITKNKVNQLALPEGQRQPIITPPPADSIEYTDEDIASINQKIFAKEPLTNSDKIIFESYINRQEALNKAKADAQEEQNATIVPEDLSVTPEPTLQNNMTWEQATKQATDKAAETSATEQEAAISVIPPGQTGQEFSGVSTLSAGLIANDAGDIYAKSGVPFKTEHTAKIALNSMKSLSGYSITKLEGEKGYALRRELTVKERSNILFKGEEPLTFKTKNQAAMYLNMKKGFDSETYRPFQLGDKWLIANKSGMDEIPVFKRTTNLIGKQMSPGEVKSYVNEFTKKWKIPTPVVKLLSELSNTDRLLAGEDGMAFYTPRARRIVIIGDRVVDKSQIERALFHELWHFGSFFSQAYNPVFFDAKNAALNIYNKRALEIADLYKFDIKNSKDVGKIANELLAQLAEDGVDMPFMKRLYADIRNKLRQYGFVETYTENDIRALVTKTLRATIAGEHHVLHSNDYDKYSLPTEFMRKETYIPPPSKEAAGNLPNADMQAFAKKWYGDKATINADGSISSADMDTFNSKTAYRPKSDLSKDTKHQIKDWVEVISSRLTKLGPRLKNDIEKNIIIKTIIQPAQFEARVDPFVRPFVAIKDPSVKTQISYALMHDKKAEAIELAGKYGIPASAFEAVFKVRQDIKNAAIKAGVAVPERETLWPRVVTNYRALRESLYGTPIYSQIDEAAELYAKKNKMRVEEVSEEEKAIMAEKLIRGYPVDKITLSKPSHAKERGIPTIPPAAFHAYGLADMSIISYIKTMTNAIAMAEMFGQYKGKGKTKISEPTDSSKDALLAQDLVSQNEVRDSIGNYIMEAKKEGLLTDITQEAELRDLLLAVYRPTGATYNVRLFKNATYLQTLTQFMPSLTQLVDYALVIKELGPAYTYKGLKATMGNKLVDAKDMGLKRVMEEIELEHGAWSGITRSAMKWSLFEKMDTLAKENLANGKLIQWKAHTNPSSHNHTKLLGHIVEKLGSGKINQALEDMKNSKVTPDTEIINKTLQDLRDGNLTDDILFMLVQEIAKIQPITRLEVPYNYLVMNWGKTFYTLKTYQIKLLNIYKDLLYERLYKQGIQKGDMKVVKEVSGEFAYLALGLFFFGLGTDAIKNFLLGKPLKLDDMTTDNLIRLTGTSRYVTTRMDKGIVETLVAQFAPPLTSIETGWKDIAELYEKGEMEKGSRTMKYIPYGGQAYYWWLGRGAVTGRERALTEAKETELKKLYGDKGYEAYLQYKKKKSEATKEASKRKRKLEYQRYGIR